MAVAVPVAAGGGAAGRVDPHRHVEPAQLLPALDQGEGDVVPPLRQGAELQHRHPRPQGPTDLRTGRGHPADQLDPVPRAAAEDLHRKRHRIALQRHQRGGLPAQHQVAGGHVDRHRLPGASPQPVGASREAQPERGRGPDEVEVLDRPVVDEQRHAVAGGALADRLSLHHPTHGAGVLDPSGGRKQAGTAEDEGEDDGKHDAHGGSIRPSARRRSDRQAPQAPHVLGAEDRRVLEELHIA